jgi:hypothetical protein
MQLSEEHMKILEAACRRVGRRYEIDPDELLGAAWMGSLEVQASCGNSDAPPALVATAAKRRAIDEARKLGRKAPVAHLCGFARDCADELADREIAEKIGRLIHGRDRPLWDHFIAGGSLTAYAGNRGPRYKRLCERRLTKLRSKLAAAWARLAGELQ